MFLPVDGFPLRISPAFPLQSRSVDCGSSLFQAKTTPPPMKISRQLFLLLSGLKLRDYVSGFYRSLHTSVLDCACTYYLVSVLPVEKAVSDALNNAVASIDAVKSIAQMLNESKNSALDELREYRRSKVDSEYSENGIKALDIALRDGEIAIDGAQSENEVNSALSSAKAAIDAVPTESEENNFDIWELRESAVSELNSYRESLRDENYGPKGIQQLSDIMVTLISELNKADSPVEVDECVARIKDNLQSVPTFKFEYQNEIYSYRASFAESDFSTFGIEQLDAAVREYAGKVLESTDKDNASIVLSDAINAMDAVEQLDGESRANVKNLAVKEITDYRNSKPRDNYDESANDELDLILSQGISKIEFSVSDTEISEIISKIKNSMDEVQTIEQTEAVLWLAQYRELFDSEAYSEENLLFLDEIVDTFIKNIFSYASHLKLYLCFSAPEQARHPTFLHRLTYNRNLIWSCGDFLKRNKR